MISSNFKKRFLTSLILLPLVILAITLNKIIFCLLLILILIICFYEWFNLNKKKLSFISVLGFIFISSSVFFAYVLRGNDNNSIMLFLWIIFVCFFSDVGGYFFGKVIGGKKITKFSPNKTFAGMYGSFIFSTFPIIFFYFIDIMFLKFNIIFLSTKTIILSLILSLICQMGDIAISYFKRKNKVKDTGKLLPGHGGLLDRIDGLIFVITFCGVLKVLKLI